MAKVPSSPICYMPTDQGTDDDCEDIDTEEIETSPLDFKEPDEFMTPFERVQKYYASETSQEREDAAKELLDACEHLDISDIPQFKSLIHVIHTLALDNELYVRQLISEFIGSFVISLNISDCEEYGTLMDSVMQFLSDTDSKVRHNNHNSILKLADNEKYREDTIKLSCDAIKELSSNDIAFQIKADSILLLSKIVNKMSPELIITEFSNLFPEYTADTMHDVRRAFAYACKDICPIVGHEYTEKLLVPLFLKLCADDFWSVRKACSEVFDKVSGACSNEIREIQLTECFLKLLSDNSRWVRKAAFETLGPFLSTFYQPDRESPEDNISPLPKTDSNDFASQPDNEATSRDDAQLMSTDSTNNANGDNINTILSNNSIFESIMQPTIVIDSTIEVSTSSYNDFNFWRDPLPELNDQEYDFKFDHQDQDQIFEFYQNNFTDSDDSINTGHDLEQSWDFGKCLQQAEEADMSLDLTLIGQEEIIPSAIYKQTRLPYKLLQEYLMMTDQKKIQHVDTELPMRCAYSLPGVALTLGKKNWACLRNLYLNLSGDLQWKIRRCLACSLHCLADICGPQIAATDLVLVFDTFLKDIDEVKSGVIAHLSEFLQTLPLTVSRKYIPVIASLKCPENKNNWRYRSSFARQLGQLVRLFPLKESIENFQPIIVDLARDQVCEVRDVACNVIVDMLEYFYALEEGRDFYEILIDILINEFARNQKWVYRKQYITICEMILLKDEKIIPAEVCSVHFLSTLCDLSKDKVPNIRMMCGKLLYTIQQSGDELMKKEIEQDPGSAQTLERLKEDNDADVRGSVGQERYGDRYQKDPTTEFIFTMDNKPVADPPKKSPDHRIKKKPILKPTDSMEFFPKVSKVFHCDTEEPLTTGDMEIDEDDGHPYMGIDADQDEIIINTDIDEIIINTDIDEYTQNSVFNTIVLNHTYTTDDNNDADDNDDATNDADDNDDATNIYTVNSETDPLIDMELTDEVTPTQNDINSTENDEDIFPDSQPADTVIPSADTVTLSADTVTLSADTATLSADTAIPSADTITLSADTVTLSADPICQKSADCNITTITTTGTNMKSNIDETSMMETDAVSDDSLVQQLEETNLNKDANESIA